jgi:checkpoint serine/threonine-protein kinase
VVDDQEDSIGGNDDNISLIEINNPCNPQDRQLQLALLENSLLALEDMDGFMDCTKLGNPPKIGNALEEAANSGPNRLCHIKFGPQLCVTFKVMRRLDAGGPSRVYLVKEPNEGFISRRALESEYFVEEADDDDEYEEDFTMSMMDFENIDVDAKPSRTSALKVQSPGSPWEFFALNILRDRLQPEILTSVATPLSCHLFSDASCLRLQHSCHGSLVDIVGWSANDGYGIGFGSEHRDGGIDELLAAFFVIEVLKVVEAIHMAGFVHGKVKAENVLVRFNKYNGAWEPCYSPNGSGGWSAKGITLIDFGKSFDLMAFPADQQFILPPEEDTRCSASTKADGTKPDRFVEPPLNCWEVLNGKPVCYEADWYGVAGILHLLLFGKALNIKEVLTSDDRMQIRLASTFKRYWQVELWNEVFDVLLNSGALIEDDNVIADVASQDDFQDLVAEFPAAAKIRETRKKIEDWLVSACSKAGKSLKSLLQRVEMSSLSK